MISRRRFVFIFGFIGMMLTIALNACKRSLSVPASYGLTPDQFQLLESIHEHLFPSTPDQPGAKEIHSVAYVKKLLSDPQVKDYDKRLLLFGIQWISETSQTLFGKELLSLTSEEKEKVLLDLVSYENGEQWISNNLTYILEALLSDPVYGSNPNEIGWSWLKHQTGYPRPDTRTKYQYL